MKTLSPERQQTIVISLAGEDDRRVIFRLRHEIFASELAQHPENPSGELTDHLDAFNIFITAKEEGKLLGFISITPPGFGKYSIDSYFSRAELPFEFNDRLYEVRLLAVDPSQRGRPIAGLLMYAALRCVEARGGRQIVAIGRVGILDFYRKVGLRPMGRRVRSGAVDFELMSATVEELKRSASAFEEILERLEEHLDWRLEVPFRDQAACYHGGSFFSAIGDEFDQLDRHRQIINADVLDAWFPPSPRVIGALQEHLPWLLRTSPPTQCEGMIRAIARARNLPPLSLLPGAGSSDLIYLALRRWLNPDSRVLILDPMYGEYAFVLEKVIGCRMDRFLLERSEGYRLNLDRLASVLKNAYDLVILVNPNSPTGVHAPIEGLRPVLEYAPPETRLWIDETYIDYAGPDQSFELFAAASENVVVCKSMSKVYALSGVRAAYLCGPARLIEALRALNPPWAVSLPGQVAAVLALEDLEYYSSRWRETHKLRRQLESELKALTDLDIIPGAANFLLCHLPERGPTAKMVIESCRRQGLFLRDAGGMGTRLGDRALRIAVKDAATQERLVDIVTGALKC